MLFVADHPLVKHKLARLRHRDTPPPQFRELVYEISQYLFYEATRDVRLKPVGVPTPMVTFAGEELADRVGIVPVLRAGLGMANAMLDALPEASVWHVGMARDHATWEPKTYYRNLPTPDKADVLLVLDPMLATGGSAVETIALLKAEGNRRVKFVGLIAAPEGVERLRTSHPDVPVVLAAVDEKLDANKYIVPGLGDAGDRQFGT
jgi:uracil phosphoribosyltransferase